MMRKLTPFRNKALTISLLFSGFILISLALQGQPGPPSFSKSFSPATIGPGSVSTLTFSITNGSASPVMNLDFTDVLPAGVTIATPANAMNTCLGGTLSAPDGGGTISYSGGSLGGGKTCTITVDVTSSTAGTHTNTSGDLISSAGNSGTASADLTVATDRPGFSKSFSPASINFGERSTLTFIIDNTANTGLLTFASFTDNFPAGMVVADPTNASTDCTGGIITTSPGSSIISFSGTGLTASSSCTVTVDVVGNSGGMLDNVSGELTSIAFPSFATVTSGKASATLDVAVPNKILLQKSFTDDPVPPGGTVTLEFSITNLDRFNSATNISFTDDLESVFSGIVATALPSNGFCGAGSSITGPSLLTFSGGNLSPGASCSFSVTLLVPAATTAGHYTNTTSPITADIAGTMVTGNPTSDILFVEPGPLLTKTFLDNPIPAGGVTTVEFTITNTSITSTATNISFTDNLSAFISGANTTGSVPVTTSCAGFGISSGSDGLGGYVLTISGGSLGPGASCTFTVDIQIPVGNSPGTFTNTTSDITATVDGLTATGKPATDDLVILAVPKITKSFTDDPVLPGGTATLAFTITYDAMAVGDATNIAFPDDLDAVITGLVATGLPANDICGIGSSIVGTSKLNFAGGTLSPGQSCTFSVPVQVPNAATAGDHLNTTGDLTATVGGLAATGNKATDNLKIAGLQLTKEFTDDPVLPGGTATLRFTINNVSLTEDAASISFSDNLNDALSGLVAVAPLPTTPCGAGSSISGTSLLNFSGGNVTAGNSCSFDVTVQVPGGAAPNTYINTTSNLTATIGGSSVTLDAATDNLIVENNKILLTKSFTDDPVAPGETVTLEFTLTNLDAVQTISSISFTDDLDAALPGLVATTLPPNGFCGAGSQITGTSLLSFTGGSLVGGGSCTFSVTLQVPSPVGFGTIANNTTSLVTGIVGGLGLTVTGAPASDVLQLNFLNFSKAFDGPTLPGGTPSLTFTIQNLSTTSAMTDIKFSDDLDAVLPGLVATALPAIDVCGSGSQLAGTSLLALKGGHLAAGGSCVFSVPLQVPTGPASVGSFLNTTSDLTVQGLSAAIPATATLTVNSPPPGFSKSFATNPGIVDGVSTLTFTIDNTGTPASASGLDFTDNLPAGLVIATPSNATSNCSGGTLTANPGTGTISYSGGTVVGGTTCTIAVDVTSNAAGTFVNKTGDLTSIFGNSGTATDTYRVNPRPGFSKSFGTNPDVIGGISTLTFTIDNTGSTVDATGLDFTDILPAGVLIATPANSSSSCIGGTLTAIPGTGIIIFSGGTASTGTSCSVAVDVTNNAAGMHVNTTGDLTSNLGNSGTATDTYTVNPPPGFSKTFSPDLNIPGGTSTLTITIDNSASTATASALHFTDILPAGILIASPAVTTNTCLGGALVANPGGASIDYSGGAVAAGSTCQIAVEVTSNSTGLFTNTTGDLTSSLGNSGTATDELMIAEFNITDNLDNTLNIIDPCSCSDLLNVLNPDGTIKLFHDILTVTFVAGQTIWLATNDGNFLDASGNPFPANPVSTPPGTIIPETGTPGVYQLEFYHPPSLAANISVTTGIIDVSFTASVCDALQCNLSIPTMSEWGILILFLLILSFATVAMRQRQMTLTGTGSEVRFNLLEMPYDQNLFIKILVIASFFVLTLFAIGITFFNYKMTGADIPGVLICLPLLAYWVQLLVFSGKPG